MNSTETKIDLAKYNGYLTIHNPESGNHRTFRIRIVKKGKLKGKRIIGLLTGPDNNSHYKDFGFVDEKGIVSVWNRKYPQKIYRQYRDLVNHAGYYMREKGFEYKFSVRCRKCNRNLTDPESISRGIGKICKGKEQ